MSYNARHTYRRLDITYYKCKKQTVKTKKNYRRCSRAFKTAKNYFLVTFVIYGFITTLLSG